MPLAVAARDYEYDDPERRELIPTRPRTVSSPTACTRSRAREEDLQKRIELVAQMSIVGGVTGVFMALQSVKDEIAQVNPRYAENISSMWRYAR